MAWLVAAAAGRRRGIGIGGSEEEEVAQRAGCQHAQRIDGNRRIVKRSAGAKSGGKKSLPLAADQQIADERDVAENIVQHVSGNQSPLEIECRLAEIDGAARVDAERAAIRPTLFDCYLTVLRGEIARQPREWDALAGEQACDAGERGDRQEPGHHRSADDLIIGPVEPADEDTRLPDILGPSACRQSATGDLAGDIEQTTDD